LKTSFRPPEPFRCDVRRAEETTFVEVAGELDIDTADQVQERLAALREGGCPDVVLDLRPLTFMDSTGLRLVIEWDAAARADGFRFSVIPGEGPVRRLFKLTGMDGHIAERAA